ncbi:substrate-binding domain-containing protein [Luteolibacter arcticus]|uniref:Substrate-binding domain-containing protein n=1 Tax=Luteolibacter arcticus TaxID=1581411 RepID=A0ABT3GLR5_9BACT|nr:substrate-binding domain-containing protein [Luteolibacter arcticus]MCW1924454.1 substrate-binding domain-containing protein [Luteolibacter arcticus]
MLGYYVREVHHGVVAYAHEAGWVLDGSMAHFGRVPADWHGDGIIAFSANRADILDKIQNENVPTVDMFNGPGMPGLPRVWIDNEAIGRMAGDYLVSRGFQEIGYFYYDPEVANPLNETERSAGLRQGVQAAGRRFHSVTFDQCVAQIRKLPRPLALMAQNDVVGDWLIHKLREEGLRVPQDVAVIGVDTDELYRAFSPVPQTSVDSNMEYQGYAAAKLLDHLLQGNSPPASPVMIQPVRVVERKSTSLLSSGHGATNKALAFMQERYAEPITVNTIARHAGLSRYHLNEHFQQHVGEPISRHLLRIRLDHAREGLADADEKIENLAFALGFKSAAYFCTVFRQETGLTPAEFRHRARIRERRPGRKNGSSRH